MELKNKKTLVFGLACRTSVSFSHSSDHLIISDSNDSNNTVQGEDTPGDHDGPTAAGESIVLMQQHGIE
jgi:hypothetical protein